MKKFNFLKTIVLALILFAGIGNAWAETATLTITRSSFPAGALAYNATDIWTATTSKGDVISGEGDLYSASGQTTLQTKNSGVSTMYHNTTAIPGPITKITLTFASGSERTYTAYMNKTTVINSTSEGTSKGTLTPKSGTPASLTLDKVDDWRYFWLNLAGGASYLNSIVIEYEVTGASCTASNLGFANPTVDKSVVDSKFTIAATSLNGTTDIVYSSTNPSVATVDAETDEVTIVGAGTTKIKANQAAGTHSGTDYCAGSAEYDLTVDPLEAPVATEATNAWKTRFFANWNAVTGATSYELNVYTKEGGANASDLFISEYVEGSSNNKYIEIYNGTGAAVDLSDYKLRTFANGKITADNDVALTGTLAHGATKVYKHSSANLALPSGVTADANGACNFNGNDAVTLYKVSTSSYVDIFGRIGDDPGTAWTGAGGYTTVDKTLVRKSSVLGGITTSPTGTGDEAFTTLTTEWDVYDTDVVSNLGSHTFAGGETITPISGSPFTVSGGSTNTYEVTGLTQMVQYYYTVKAKNGSFESAASNEVSAMIDMGTGVNNTAALSGISVQNGNLKVSATAGTLIEVYNIAGQKIVSQTAKEGVNTIAIAQRGAMIVKIGTETVKVVF